MKTIEEIIKQKIILKQEHDHLISLGLCDNKCLDKKTCAMGQKSKKEQKELEEWKIIGRYCNETVGRKTCENCGDNNRKYKDGNHVVVWVITNGKETKTLCSDCEHKQGISSSF